MRADLRGAVRGRQAAVARDGSGARAAWNRTGCWRSHLLGPVAPRLGFSRRLERKLPARERDGLLLFARKRTWPFADVGATRAAHRSVEFAFFVHERTV